jgi:hypothetical protein
MSAVLCLDHRRTLDDCPDDCHIREAALAEAAIIARRLGALALHLGRQ